MRGRWKDAIMRDEFEEVPKDQAGGITEDDSVISWSLLAKLLMGIHLAGLFGIYCYSVYLGFGAGFFKGCCMLLLPIVAQVWLFFEEWACNPCGFSSTYVTLSFCVLLIAVLSGIAHRMSEFPSGLSGKTEKSGLLILGAAVIALGYYRYTVMGKGASSPEDVAHAYVIAASRFDMQMAKYYSGRGMQDWYEDIELEFRDRKDDLVKLSKLVAEAVEGLSFRVEKLGEDPMFGNIRVSVDIIGHGHVLSTEYLTLEKQYGDWKVVDGGKFEAQWKEIAKRVRGLH